MSDLQVIDTVPAWTLESGDTIRVEGSDYTVIGDVVPYHSSVIVRVIPLDETDEVDEIILDADTLVQLLDFDYSDVEV